MWVDLHGGGNPDAARLDRAGTRHIFLNRRAGSFVETTVARAVGAAVAAAIRGDNPDANGTDADLSRGGLDGNDPRTGAARVPVPLSSPAMRTRRGWAAWRGPP